MNQQIQELKAHNKMVDSQLAQVAINSSLNSSSKLPGQPNTKPSHNLKQPDTCKAITLRSGASYEGPKGSEEVEKEGEDKKGDEEVNVEKEVGDKKSKGKDPIDTRKYDNPVPYPGRVAERRLNDKFAKFLDVMKGLHINLPFLEVVTQMPSYAKFLKDIQSNKRKLKDEFITLPHQVSALVQHKMPKKQRDPGSFTLSVKIGNLGPKGALADLGASVSLMPLSIAQQLNIEMIPTSKTIQLADRSVKLPCGEIEDVPIQVGQIYVPCDFVVMDMEEDENTTLIFGRETLKTLGAVINCKNNTITCEVADEKIVFEFSKLLKTPMVEKCYRVDVVGEKLDCLGRVMMSPQDPIVEALTCEEEYYSHEAKEFVMTIEEAKREEENDPKHEELAQEEEKLEEKV
ncbi:uncharacterized protein LOC110724381 [Chenopodium quinoa]|uniref:uncharacterized protein LOC110724381 n=1 Tax=Chenopodium quinoa TaxID=63459 RepID=UPI000B783A61|nr:uncharacterized protein LOC110724381 [Chenopodium quinoa]